MKKGTKERIKELAVKLFNTKDTVIVTTNHIAQALGMSPGNLYYHFKNKEEIVLAIYEDIVREFRDLKSVARVKESRNPLKEMLFIYQEYADIFWKYRFLMRDAAVLQRVYPRFKERFKIEHTKELQDLEEILNYLVAEGILISAPTKELQIRAKLHWLISSYWQVFAQGLNGESKESIGDSVEVLFWSQTYPHLTFKGKRISSRG